MNYPDGRNIFCMIRDGYTGSKYIGLASAKYYTGASKRTVSNQIRYGVSKPENRKYHFTLVANPTREDYDRAMCIGPKPTFKTVLHDTEEFRKRIKPPREATPRKSAAKPYQQPHGLTLCWSCKKCTGFCSWSKEFRPIPGWDAEETTHNSSAMGASRSYFVYECPEFVPDDK